MERIYVPKWIKIPLDENNGRISRECIFSTAKNGNELTRNDQEMVHAILESLEEMGYLSQGQGMVSRTNKKFDIIL